MTEIAQRFPPPLYTPGGPLRPTFIECSSRVRLKGVLVQCIQRAGHKWPTHHNGYQEWAFDADPEETI